MRRVLSLLVLLLGIALAADAGTTGGMPGQTFYAGEARTRIRLHFAVVPDVQNYCSSLPASSHPGPNDATEGPRLLDILTRDIVAWAPDFVLQVGDLADQASTNGNDATDADNFTTNSARYGESLCIKAHFTDALDNAGIPHFETTGNHDSYRDYERVWPRATFLTKPWAYAAQNEVDLWHVGFSDTEERAAKFTTPIGTICAVSMDFVNTSALDHAFANTNIGCGAGSPTIMVAHDGVYSGGGANPPLSEPGNTEIFMQTRGHTTGVSTLQSFSTITAPAGMEYADLFTNSQESSLDCGADTHSDGTSIHTGVTWWTMVEIVPAENSITIMARNPLYGATSRDPACGYTYQNGVVNLSPSFCTRFPGGPGC